MQSKIVYGSNNLLKIVKGSQKQLKAVKGNRKFSKVSRNKLEQSKAALGIQSQLKVVKWQLLADDGNQKQWKAIEGGLKVSQRQSKVVSNAVMNVSLNQSQSKAVD